MYGNVYNPQVTRERIDNQIAQLQQMKEQIPITQNQPAINQTFQIAPTSNNGMKFVDNIEAVEKELVYFDTPFFSRDMSVMWIKNYKNEIKSYTLAEIIQKDEKDLLIESLQYQIKELKEGKNNAKSNIEYVNEPVESKKSSNGSIPKSSKSK